MAERMEERHQFADVPRHPDGLLHPLVVQKRAFYQLLQRLEVPLGMVLRDHDLRTHARDPQVNTKIRTMHTHPPIKKKLKMVART